MRWGQRRSDETITKESKLEHSDCLRQGGEAVIGIVTVDRKKDGVGGERPDAEMGQAGIL